MKRNMFKRISAKKFDWSMEEISNTHMRRRWKRTWKKAARRAMKEAAYGGFD